MNCLQTKFAGVRESGGVEDIPINSLPYKIIIYIIPQLSTQYASEGEITIFVVLDSFIKYVICLQIIYRFIVILCRIILFRTGFRSSKIYDRRSGPRLILEY